MPFSAVDETRAQYDRVRAACLDIGRDPRTVRRSVALTLCCGRDDAEVRRRAAAIDQDPDNLRRSGVAGTPMECVETLARYAEVGAGRAYLQTLDVDDLEHIELVAAEVAPQLR